MQSSICEFVKRESLLVYEVYERMVVIVTDGSEGTNLEGIRGFFTINELKFHILPIEGFKECLKGDVALIIYDVLFTIEK